MLTYSHGPQSVWALPSWLGSAMRLGLSQGERAVGAWVLGGILQHSAGVLWGFLEKFLVCWG